MALTTFGVAIMKKIYTYEYKINLVKTFLKSQQADNELSIAGFVKQHYPHLNLNSVYNWVSSLKSTAGQELSMSENEVQNKYGASANEMSLKQKFAMYRECFSLPSEEERGAYCRQHQIYMADLESWGQEIEESVNFSADSQSLTLENNQMKAECQQLKQQLHKAESENKNLSQKMIQKDQELAQKDQELAQKDKALATFAAQVITLKNFHQLFTCSLSRRRSEIILILYH